MYEFHPYFTNDGSVGLYSTDFNDIYHSATGALTEAYEKFIYPVDFNNLLQKDKIKVLDICYGIGYNSKSFLNFIFENYCQKKFSKKYSLTKHYIDKIHTNNILQTLFDDFIYKNNIYNEQIYTDNIFDKISITAIDNDKILSYISPFIKTGVKNFKNVNIDFKYNAIDEITPPNISDPVSPINTFAGCKLNIKNPKVAPITILPNIETSYIWLLIPITVKHVIIKQETLDDNPSTPCVKLIAFVVESITNTASGIYKNTGILIYILNIGIYVSVPKLKP